MNSEQRARIVELRGMGLGYKSIAKELDLTRDTVKGYCKRQHLNGPKEVVRLNVQIMNEDKSLCPQCKALIKQPMGRGRRKRFCCEACRRKWWNDHPDQGSKLATFYKYTCPHCGVAFSCYANKTRKYCSHQCYIKSRFWGEENELCEIENR